MRTVAIELNDAELRVADAGGLVVRQPGYGWLDGDQVRVGDDAFRAASLQPRDVHHRYWSELDQAPIRRAGARTLTHADLAYAQLAELWQACAGADGALLVAPGWMGREQLALLLGIAAAAGVPVRGLVDAAVASCERSFPGARLLHWDVGLHLAGVTVLGQEGAIERRDFEPLPKLGLVALREAQVAGIARAFVEQARFDPLHDAGGEQALHERLPDFVAALRDRAAARIELDHRGVTRHAEIRRDDLARPAAALFRALRESAERGGAEPVVALVSHRIADLPGFDEAMARATRLEIVRLDPDAACRGALARLEQIPRGKAGHRHVRRLAPAAASPAPPAGPAPAAAPTAPAPTHVVHEGVAHPLRGERFALGAEPGPGPGLAIAGLAPRQAAIVREDEGVAVEAEPSRAVFVNGAPVAGRTPLRAGDRLRLGEPGVELQLVAVRESRGP